MQNLAMLLDGEETDRGRDAEHLWKAFRIMKDTKRVTSSEEDPARSAERFMGGCENWRGVDGDVQGHISPIEDLNFLPSDGARDAKLSAARLPKL